MRVPAPANDNFPDSVRYRVDPRCVSPQKAARRMGLSLATLERCAPALESRGFPAPCPVTGQYDLRAIDAYLDRQAGLAPPAGAVADQDVTALVMARLAAHG